MVIIRYGPLKEVNYIEVPLNTSDCPCQEGQDDSCELPTGLTATHQQIQRLSQAEIANNPSTRNPQVSDPLEFPATENQPVHAPSQPEVETPEMSRMNSQAETLPQPDHEPANSRQPTPEDEVGSLTQQRCPLAESAESLLTCEDIDWTLHASSTETALAWRCEFDVNLMKSRRVLDNAGHKLQETTRRSQVVRTESLRKSGI